MSHWQSLAKFSKADKIFSELIRTEAGWKCQKCKLDFSDNRGYLTNSHYHGRRKKSVRFDLDNCTSLCRKCHNYFEEHKSDYKEWMTKRLGEEGMALLQLRAETPNRCDETAIILMCKNILSNKER